LTGGKKVFIIAPKWPINELIGREYKTRNAVPPKTVNIEGTLIKGIIPPPATIAPMTIPTPPISPIIAAISIG
jgi:hypothetical protein